MYVVSLVHSCFFAKGFLRFSDGVSKRSTWKKTRDSKIKEANFVSDSWLKLSGSNGVNHHFNKVSRLNLFFVRETEGCFFLGRRPLPAPPPGPPPTRALAGTPVTDTTVDAVATPQFSSSLPPAESVDDQGSVGVPSKQPSQVCFCFESLGVFWVCWFVHFLALILAAI